MKPKDDDLPVELQGIRHVHQYQDVWAMHELHFQAGIALVGNAEAFKAYLAERQAAMGNAREKNRYTMSGDTAVIRMAGSMTKYGSSFSDLPEGTIGIRRAVRQAARDAEVKSIMLVIDSPGGAVSGTSDLAEDVAMAKKRKPVTAYIEDLGASAAYWVASQASRVVANSGGLVGSIGTYMVVRDFSGWYAQNGVKTVLVKAGEHKGDGVEGTEITAGQIQEFQRVVDGINQTFINTALVKGRGMDKETAAEIADGRIHTAKEAKRLGLIDAVESFDTAMNQLARTARTVSQVRAETKEVSMSDDQTAGKSPATFEDLKLYLVGADNDFIVSQLDAKATVEQARSTWAEEQVKRTDALKAELAKAKEEAEAKDQKPGVEALTEDGKATSEIADPRAEWREAIAAKEKAGMSRERAVKAVAKERPELREALVDAANQ